MKIHKEGYLVILVAFLILGLLDWFLYWVIPHTVFWVIEILWLASAIFYFLIVYFFRVPTLNVNADENAIIAPAEGKVVVIEEVEENEYFKDKRIQLSIFMSPLNVHVNRYPIKGKIDFYKYHSGHYYVAWHPKSSTENERTTVVVENDKGNKILFRQIAGAVARRIISYAKEGKEIAQTEECGFIRFGSRVDVFVPLDAKIKVELNQKVTGGETVLATFE